jgi:hypothetical protein
LILCVPPQAKGFPEEKNSTQHTSSSSPDDLENAKARSTSAAAIALRETMRCFKIHEAGAAGQPRQPVHPVCLPKLAQIHAKWCALPKRTRIHQEDAMTVRVDRGGIEFLRSA